MNKAIKGAFSRQNSRERTVNFQIYNGVDQEGNTLHDYYLVPHSFLHDPPSNFSFEDYKYNPIENIYSFRSGEKVELPNSLTHVPSQQSNTSYFSRFSRAAKAFAAAGLMAFVGGIYSGISSTDSRAPPKEEIALESIVDSDPIKEVINHELFDHQVLDALALQSEQPKTNKNPFSNLSSKAVQIADDLQEFTTRSAEGIVETIDICIEGMNTLNSLASLGDYPPPSIDAAAQQGIKGTQYCIELFRGSVKEAMKYADRASKRESLRGGRIEVRDEVHQMAVLFHNDFKSMEEAKTNSQYLNERFHYYSKPVQFVHPETIISKIINVANQQGVDPNLALLVAERESKFWQYAKSKSGARGIFQIMLPAALDIAKDEGVYTPKEYDSLLRKSDETQEAWYGRILWSMKKKGIDVYDIDTNIRYGITKLKDEMDFFENNRHALAAFNAGRGNVIKYDGIPPFKETINYVRIIHGVYVADLPAHLRDMLEKYQCDSLQVRKS